MLHSWAPRLLPNGIADATHLATIAFIVIWLVVAAANIWVGVARAGYSVVEEMPIFLLIFGLPTGVAVLVRWKFLDSALGTDHDFSRGSVPNISVDA